MQQLLRMRWPNEAQAAGSGGRVAALLRAAGHDVYTPTLTGLGERVHLAHPDIDLDTHIQDILMVLEYEDLHDVILVGYSYSGMVITGVAEHAPERQAQLVYLDAFVPQDGQSLEMLGPERGRFRADGAGLRRRLAHSTRSAGRAAAHATPAQATGQPVSVTNRGRGPPAADIHLLHPGEGSHGAVGIPITQAAARAKADSAGVIAS